MRCPAFLRRVNTLAAVLFGVYALAFSGSGAAVAASPHEVDAGIAKAKAFIYSQQNKEGTWEANPKGTLHGPAPLWGGYTALATYTLLAAGENPADPKLKRAVTFLETEDIRLAYAVGLRDQTLLMLPSSKEISKIANSDSVKLLGGIDAMGRNSYEIYNLKAAPVAAAHNSTSQYGVLAMWACDRLGAEIPMAYWKTVEDGWIACQGPDGGWAYGSAKPAAGNPAKASMTAAGVATLLITQNYLHHGTECRGNIDMPQIDMGFKWLGDNFASIPDGYTWYGIERIGVAGGYKYIGKHDWYQEGAERIVRSQGPGGNWGVATPGGTPLIEACFNLVFLSRGSAPMAINKLRYNALTGGKLQQGHWNQRPRDCFNFLNWMDRSLETTLNWQIVDLANGSQQDLNDAPVLYIAGNQALDFSEEEVGKLRGYIQQGGLIVGNPDCESADFSKAFRELGSKLFPLYEFRELPQEHPIFTGEQFRAAKWGTRMHVQAMSNGVREIMLLPGTDMSRAFQGRNTIMHADTYQLLDDIILYACDKTGLREKGSTYLVTENAAAPVTRSIKVARITYAGNWDPEPFGWKQVAATLHNNDKLGLTTEAIKLGEGTLIGHNPAAVPPPPTEKELREQALKQIPADQVVAAAADPAKLEALIKGKIVQMQAEAAKKRPALPYAVCHITGTTAFTFDDAQRKELLAFADGGGTIIVDAAGGSGEFAAAADKELTAIFGPDTPKALMTYLPMDHPLFNQPGAKIDAIAWRRYARERMVGSLKAARIAAIIRNGRPVAFVSHEDITGGLVGQPMDGILGYDPQTAIALMRNMILLAAPK